MFQTETNTQKYRRVPQESIKCGYKSLSAELMIKNKIWTKGRHDAYMLQAHNGAVNQLAANMNS